MYQKVFLILLSGFIFSSKMQAQTLRDKIIAAKTHPSVKENSAKADVYIVQKNQLQNKTYLKGTEAVKNNNSRKKTKATSAKK